MKFPQLKELKDDEGQLVHVPEYYNSDTSTDEGIVNSATGNYDKMKLENNNFVTNADKAYGDRIVLDDCDNHTHTCNVNADKCTLTY